MLKVKSVDEVYSLISESFKSYELGVETISIKDAVGRISSKSIISNESIPGFNRSSVDGFAVVGSSTFGCSDSIPAQLELVGEVKMGEKPNFEIISGQAAYIPTGGELPAGADSVVMVEYTENINDGFIYINKAVAPGNNVVNKGDDVKEAQVIFEAGKLLRPQDIGALAAIGQGKIEVKKRLKVGIISTGDEVIAIDETPTASKVRDVNSYALYAGLISMGADPVMYGIVEDSFESILFATKKAVNECDIVLISGGSSVGEKDETYKIIKTLGNVLVHGIAIKPGKPTIVGNVEGKAVFGLPGHPASAYFIFKLFVGFLISLIYGPYLSQKISAYMGINYPSNTGREEYLPIKLESTQNIESMKNMKPTQNIIESTQNNDGFIAQPILGKSGFITLLTKADGYVRIPRGAEGVVAGQKVEVILF